jgi:3-hydroxyisobutyrate dehydrogenase
LNVNKLVGVIGIGLVGTAISKILINRNYKVFGYDPDTEKMDEFVKLGGYRCHSPQDVAIKTNRMILCLMTSDIVHEAIFGENGILKAENPSLHYIIDTTTSDPQKTEEMAEALEQMQIYFLDSTISGSSKQIENRKGVIMVGGNKKAFEANSDIYQSLSDSCIYMGVSSMASKAKLAVNLVLGLNRLVLAEGLVFAEKMGISKKKALKLFESTYAYSKIMENKGPLMINNDFKPRARLKQHRKDVKMILQYGEKNQQSLPVSALHLNILDNAIKNGDGDLDNSAIIKEIERMSNN